MTEREILGRYESARQAAVEEAVAALLALQGGRAETRYLSDVLNIPRLILDRTLQGLVCKRLIRRERRLMFKPEAYVLLTAPAAEPSTGAAPPSTK